MSLFVGRFSLAELELIQILTERGIGCIWLVYPASEEVFAKYFPHVADRRNALNPIEFNLVGYYSAGDIGVVSAIVTIPGFPAEFGRLELSILMEKIQQFAAAIGVQGVALAGILPGLFSLYNIPIGSPCVRGDLGTIHAITQTLTDALKVYGLVLTTAPIRILGYGFVGRALLREFKRLGCSNLVVVETHFQGTYWRDGVLFSGSQKEISAEDWVVFVAGGGADVDIDELWNVFGVNDMYPPFSAEQMQQLEAQGNRTLEVALRASGVVSNLKIEQFAQDQFPGCMGQGLVQASGKDTSGMNQAEYNFAAWCLGIRSGIDV